MRALNSSTFVDISCIKEQLKKINSQAIYSSDKIRVIADTEITIAQKFPLMEVSVIRFSN